MGRIDVAVVAAVVCCAPTEALGQAELSAAVGVPAEAQGPPTESLAAPAVPLEIRTATIPSLTEIAVEILVDLGSKTSRQGESFPLRLAAPIVVEGVELIPAGAPGMGEVIHAKKNGGSGAAGELILTARYLEIGPERLPLRSLRLEPIAKDRMGTVNAINVGAAATVPLLGLVGFLIKGDQISVAAGTILPAKTAGDFVVPIGAPSEASDAASIETDPATASAATAAIDHVTGGNAQ